MVGFILACLGHRYRAVAGSNPALPTNSWSQLLFLRCYLHRSLCKVNSLGCVDYDAYWFGEVVEDYDVGYGYVEGYGIS